MDTGDNDYFNRQETLEKRKERKKEEEEKSEVHLKTKRKEKKRDDDINDYVYVCIHTIHSRGSDQWLGFGRCLATVRGRSSCVQ